MSVLDDEEIERRVRNDVIVRTLRANPADMRITVHDGVVTLSGELELHSQALVAAHVTRSLDVVDDLIWKDDDIVPLPPSGAGRETARSEPSARMTHVSGKHFVMSCTKAS